MLCERCGAIAEKGQRKYCKACRRIVDREQRIKYEANSLRQPKVWVDPSEHFVYEAKICLNCERSTCTNCLGWKTMKEKQALLAKIESGG
jgi:hypothetical protein